MSSGLKWSLSLILLAGCSHSKDCPYDSLVARILPVDGVVAADLHQGETALPERSAVPDSGASAESLPPPRELPEQPADAGTTFASCRPSPEQCLGLHDAIDTAFRTQPRLRVYLEGIEQARGGATIAFAPFLPAASVGYSVGGFELNVGGQGVNLPGLPPFTFLPPSGTLPIGLNIQSGYELAELRMQWLICDFGRRLGRYHQATIAVDIAQLQTTRAFQTVANEVELAYYQVLRARALRKSAQEAVRRAEDDLGVARKLRKGGAVETEKVLRAEVQVAQSSRLLDQTEGAEAIAIAALNLAIGLNVNAPTCIVETSDTPPFAHSLPECLEMAVVQRREFEVARRTIQSADEGTRVAKADFAPRIVAEGLLLDFQQASPRGHFDLPLGFIKLEWGIFEGGKRVGEMRVANAKVRAAMAQAESIADTIAFQVTEAYRLLIVARRGIDRSRPAVEQARETYRLVQARNKLGDATTAEVVDAETALTRAEQDYLNSTYDYMTALSRLEYAMGSTPTPDTLAACGGR
jgi:outer membrane protein TolC